MGKANPRKKVASKAKDNPAAKQPRTRKGTVPALITVHERPQFEHKTKLFQQENDGSFKTTDLKTITQPLEFEAPAIKPYSKDPLIKKGLNPSTGIYDWV